MLGVRSYPPAYPAMMDCVFLGEDTLNTHQNPRVHPGTLDAHAKNSMDLHHAQGCKASSSAEEVKIRGVCRFGVGATTERAPVAVQKQKERKKKGKRKEADLLSPLNESPGLTAIRWDPRDSYSFFLFCREILLFENYFYGNVLVFFSLPFFFFLLFNEIGCVLFSFPMPSPSLE